MNVLFIRPPYTRLRGTGQAPYFPLGIGYLASSLKQNGFKAGIYNGEICHNKDEIPKIDKKNIFYSRSDAQKLYLESLKNDNHIVWGEIREYIEDFAPDIIGISLLSVEVGSAAKVSQIAKTISPDIKVVWGGVHPTFLPEDCLNIEDVDYVILGEGEKSFLELSWILAGKKKDDISSINGLAFKTHEGVQVNPACDFIDDLDSIPFPARDLLLNGQKDHWNMMGSIITSRGCPYRCTFCSSKEFWHRKVRTRSAKNVLDEMKVVINNYGTRFFTFWDDSFSLNRNIINEICESLIQEKIRVSWRTATRADLLDRETLSLMKKSGCFQVELGVETGSLNVAKMIKKDLDLDAVSESVKLINDAGIASGAFFMTGFPGEKEEDLDQTFEYMKKLDATEIVINVFDPMPGSEIYEDMIKSGQLEKPIDWLKFPLWPDKHYANLISPEIFNEKINRIAEWVFSNNMRLSNCIRHLKPKVLSLLRSTPLLLIKKALNIFR